MNLKISSILRSGILAQTIFLAGELPVAQAQYTQSRHDRNITHTQHPVISAAPKESTKPVDSNKLLGCLLLGGGAITAGAYYGIKSISNLINKKQGELNEILTCKEKAALKRKLSKNDALIETIQKILKQRGGIDPKICK